MKQYITTASGDIVQRLGKYLVNKPHKFEACLAMDTTKTPGYCNGADALVLDIAGSSTVVNLKCSP